MLQYSPAKRSPCSACRNLAETVSTVSGGSGGASGLPPLLKKDSWRTQISCIESFARAGGGVCCCSHSRTVLGDLCKKNTPGVDQIQKHMAERRGLDADTFFAHA